MRPEGVPFEDGKVAYNTAERLAQKVPCHTSPNLLPNPSLNPEDYINVTLYDVMANSTVSLTGAANQIREGKKKKRFPNPRIRKRPLESCSRA